MTQTVQLASLQSVQLLNDGQMSNDGLLQANDGKMLVNDGEMLVNDGEMLVNDGEMSMLI